MRLSHNAIAYSTMIIADSLTPREPHSAGFISVPECAIGEYLFFYFSSASFLAESARRALALDACDDFLSDFHDMPIFALYFIHHA